VQLIGHILQMAVALPNGDVINIEGHTDKYSGKLAAGENALVAWQAGRATVIGN
jgi:flagellar motor protein MotB